MSAYAQYPGQKYILANSVKVQDIAITILLYSIQRFEFGLSRLRPFVAHHCFRKYYKLAKKNAIGKRRDVCTMRLRVNLSVWNIM